MNIHSRLPVSASWAQQPERPAGPGVRRGRVLEHRAGGNCGATTPTSAYWRVPTSTTLFRGLMPGVARGIEGALAANGINIDLESGKGFWEYPEDLRIFGVSAATNLFGWSTSAEFSYQENIPLMVNGNDLIAAACSASARTGTRRQRSRRRAQARTSSAINASPSGSSRRTSSRLQQLHRRRNPAAGGRGGRAVEQRARLHRGRHPLRPRLHVRHRLRARLRSGRQPEGQPTLGGASLGIACSPTFVGLPVPVFNTLYNPQPIGCKNDGFVTDFAWGYRLRVSMDYNNV